MSVPNPVDTTYSINTGHKGLQELKLLLYWHMRVETKCNETHPVNKQKGSVLSINESPILFLQSIQCYLHHTFCMTSIEGLCLGAKGQFA